MKDIRLKDKLPKKHCKKLYKKIIAFLSVAAIVGAAIGINSYRVYSEGISGEADAETVEVREEISATESTSVSETSALQVPSEDALEENHPAYERSVNVEGVRVSVEADEGVFPENTWLSVERVARDDQEKIDEAVGRARDKGVNTAVSYTYDIKVFNEDNEEIQPKDEKSVRISFTADEVASSNLDTKIYHVEGKNELHVTELDVETKGDVATAVTDGFSYYTVEFTYGDKQHVLEGGDCIKLSDLLESVDLKGNVESYSVSNPELFAVYLGYENEASFKEIEENIGGDTHVTVEYMNDTNGTVPYVVTLKPFDTEEWMDVVIDGVKYRITVTDDYQNINGNQTATGVVQGENENNFTKEMPLADIFIDYNVVNQGAASRNNTQVALQGSYASDTRFKFVNPTGYAGNNNKFLSYLPNTTDVIGGGQNNFSGDIVKYTFKDGAKVIDPISGEETKYDVVITYSDLMVTYNSNGSLEGMRLGLFCGNLIGIGASNGSSGKADNNNKYAIEVDINIQVVDPNNNNEPISGNFYFPMVDVDVIRPQGGYNGFYNAEARKYYSEQVVITGGLASDVFIPGGDYNPSIATHPLTNMPYLPTIENTTEGFYIYPGQNYTAVNKDGIKRDNDFYTGFAVLADNSTGINLAWRGSSASLNGDSYRSGINSYLLAGDKNFNWLYVSSTGEGGTITTTRLGNHNGLLNDGGAKYEATENNQVSLTAATGQTIKYTMKPQLGYRLKEVKVNTSKSNINESGTATITPTEITMPDGSTAYTYEFPDIKSDGSIHVEWEPSDVKVQKTVSDNGGVSSADFNFRLKITAPNDTLQNVTATKAHVTTTSYKLKEVSNPSKISGTQPLLLYYGGDDKFIGYENNVWVQSSKTKTAMASDDIKDYYDNATGGNYSSGYWWDVSGTKTPNPLAKYNGTDGSDNPYQTYAYPVKHKSTGEWLTWIDYDPNDYDLSHLLLQASPPNSGLMPDSYSGPFYVSAFPVKDDLNEDNRIPALHIGRINGEYRYSEWLSNPPAGEVDSGGTYPVAHAIKWYTVEKVVETHEFTVDDSIAAYPSNPPAALPTETKTVIENKLAEKGVDYSSYDNVRVIKEGDGETYSISDITAIVNKFNTKQTAAGQPTLGNETFNGRSVTYDFTLSYNESSSPTPSVDLKAVIPFGWSYEIYEIDKDGTKVNKGGDFETDDTGVIWTLDNVTGKDNGEMTAPGETVTFTNKNPHSLTVSKTVTGNMGSKEKYFKFAITITAPEGTTLTLNSTNLTTAGSGTDTNKPNSATIYSTGTIVSANKKDDNATLGGQQIVIDTGGTETFSLYMQSGQSFVITGLPTGAGYTITETKEDYVLTADLSGGEDKNKDDATGTGTKITLTNGTTITDNYLKGDANVALTNDKGSVAPTGIDGFPSYWLAVTGALIGGVVIYIIKKKKDKSA